MASKNVKALAERIKSEFGFEVNTESFERTYAGHWQRSAGAYSWTMKAAGGLTTIGGCEPVSKYVAKRNLLEIEQRYLFDFELFAYGPNDYGYERLKKERIKDENERSAN